MSTPPTKAPAPEKGKVKQKNQGRSKTYRMSGAHRDHVVLMENSSPLLMLLILRDMGSATRRQVIEIMMRRDRSRNRNVLMVTFPRLYSRGLIAPAGNPAAGTDFDAAPYQLTALGTASLRGHDAGLRTKEALVLQQVACGHSTRRKIEAAIRESGINFSRTWVNAMVAGLEKMDLIEETGLTSKQEKVWKLTEMGRRALMRAEEFWTLPEDEPEHATPRRRSAAAHAQH